MFDANSPLAIRTVGARFARDDENTKARTVATHDLGRDLEIADADPTLLVVLARDPGKRALLRHVVIELGAVIVGRAIHIDRRALPSSLEAVSAITIPLVELAHWLIDPESEEKRPAIGTKSAVYLRALHELEGAARSRRLEAFFDGFGATRGGGRCEPHASEDAFVWVPRRAAFPTRVSVARSGTVTLHVAIEHGMHGLIYTFDPEVRADVLAPVRSREERRRVFVGRSTYATCGGISEAPLRRRLARVPEAFALRVSKQLPEDRIRDVRIETGGVTLSFWDGIDELRDPEGQLEDALALLEACARFLAGLPPVPSEPVGFDDGPDDDVAPDRG